VLVLALVESAAEAVASSFVEVRHRVWISDRRGQRELRPSVGDALMRPVSVVELLELALGHGADAAVQDQGPVQEFVAAGLHPIVP
jgi:hypothetical protein